MTQTPTTAEISANIVAQIETQIGQTVPLLPKAFIRVLAKALAGVFVLLYKYGGYIFLQIFASTADFRETTVNGRKIRPLVFWGRLIGVGDPYAATAAELDVTVTVTNQTGSLPIGTQLRSSANGVTYLTSQSYLLDAATKTIRVRAVSDDSGGDGTGSIGNLEAGAELTFANPIANVARAATVAAQAVTASDAETEAAYRQRVEERFQRRPQGGAYADYEQWGETVAGIANVYPYTGDPGEVDIYVEATPESSGSAEGIPTAAQLDAVKAAIELDENGLASLRPANAYVNTYAISRVAFTIDVTGLTVDNPADVQADIEAAIGAYMAEREPFISGLHALPRKDRIVKSAIAGAVERVVTGAGGLFGDVTLYQSGVATDLYALGEGEKAKVTAVNFV